MSRAPRPTWAPNLWRTTSTGLACGNTSAEALTHALLEVIERHALAVDDTVGGILRTPMSVPAAKAVSPAPRSTPVPAYPCARAPTPRRGPLRRCLRGGVVHVPKPGREGFRRLTHQGAEEGL
ncbi:YcaO-like family protein [Streptomyces sp. NPDC058467]|uniref:YcaO-like family protein n=1 Tax=Streptomyces sp. NPDC058467 TaxID=3346513 RepID=UPI00364CBCBC